MKLLKDSFTFQFPNRDDSKVSVYPVALLCILLIGCCIFVIDLAAALIVVIFLLQLIMGTILYFNYQTFGITKRKNVWGVVLSHALMYWAVGVFIFFYWTSRNKTFLYLGIFSAAAITAFLIYLYNSMRKIEAPIQKTLDHLDKKADESLVLGKQILEQTAGVPYFVDQANRESQRDFQRINALKVSLNLDDVEQKILKFHDQKYTQQQIANQLDVNVRTVQRYAASIEKKFADRELPSPFTWNNRKKNREE